MSAPWIKFYPRDWRGDHALRAVSIGARGLWIEMLCIMHEADPYGYLLLGDVPITAATLARMVGLFEEDVAALLAELEKASVFGRNRAGVIFSRRMIKDEKRSKIGRKHASKRWSENSDNKGENRRPNGSAYGGPYTSPITQKPEARIQKAEDPSLFTESEPRSDDAPLFPKEPDFAAPSPASGPARYAFQGAVIKLNEVDLEAWKHRFRAIPDFTAELWSCDAWLLDQDEDKRKKWFHLVQGMLNRKHQEWTAKPKPPREPLIGI